MNKGKNMTIKVFDVPYGNNFSACDYLSDNGDLFMHDKKYLFSSDYGDWMNCEWLIVVDSPYACFYTNIPIQKRILFVSEPPEIHDVSKINYYINQFGHIVSPYNIPNYSGNLIISNPNLAWTAGIHTKIHSIKDAINFTTKKSSTLSIITSLKNKTQYHKKRVKFLHELQREFNGIIDCYGREFNPVDDKLTAIAPYKYNIVIENSRINHYWTEKLTDAWLGWALPIYCGDPLILNEIPDKNGIILIDINDIKSSLKTIHEVINQDIYYSRLNAIKICREWAINNSNRYSTACKIVEAHDNNTQKLKTPELFKTLISPRKNIIYEFLSIISHDKANKFFEEYCRYKGRLWE